MREFLPENIVAFLDRTYLQNTVEDFLIAFLIIAVGVTVIKSVRTIAKKRLSAMDNVYAKYALYLDPYVYPLIFLTIIFSAFHFLTFRPRTTTFVDYAFTVGFIFLSIRLITAAVRRAILSYVATQDDTGQKSKQVRGIVLILNAILWIIGLIFLFDNLGFNVTAIITGLGVGGIAIALAAQTILGDLFNYFVIFFDQPFEIGDFIIVDDKMGAVEYVGLKTTRIKSLSGEQIIFSNTNLTNSRIHNYKRMLERRIVFKLGLVYDTTNEHLEEVPKIIRSIIESQDKTRFDRAHFASFGDYSLNFEVVYYVLSPDYNQYMNIQQNINLQIFKSFGQKGIAFAFPTYTLDVSDATSGKLGFILSGKENTNYQRTEN